MSETPTPLLDVLLGPQDRAELLRDLSALASVASAQIEVERACGDRSTRACRLDEVFAALEEGTARRALIRYTYAGQTWVDTLLPGAEGVRLIRVAEADVLAGQEDA